MSSAEEILDLVDNTDTVIGQVRRGDFEGTGPFPKGNIRVADVLIMNSLGELWIPRRSLKKRMFPGGLDFSASEHVNAGETYEQAAVRGLQEELRIIANPKDITLLGVLPPDPAANLPIFCGTFLFRSDDQPDYNHDDYMGAEWLHPQTLLDRLQAGEPAKRNVIYAIKAFFNQLRVEVS